METIEIKNIKTSKTERQIEDEIKSLKSKKMVHLSNTDWTQLKDVPLSNSEDFKNWRQELRNFKIRSLSDETKLKKIISKKPVPVINNDASEELIVPESKQHTKNSNFEIENTFLDHIENISVLENNQPKYYINRNDAENALTKLLIEEKDKDLRYSDISSYALYRLLQEELVEYDLDKTQPCSFLKKYMESVGLDITSSDDLETIRKKCRDYFSKINSIFFKFENKILSVYTMSEEQLTEELDTRGHRYRPAE